MWLANRFSTWGWASLSGSNSRAELRVKELCFFPYLSLNLTRVICRALRIQKRTRKATFEKANIAIPDSSGWWPQFQTVKDRGGLVDSHIHRPWGGTRSSALLCSNLQALGRRTTPSVCTTASSLTLSSISQQHFRSSSSSWTRSLPPLPASGWTQL